MRRLIAMLLLAAAPLAQAADAQLGLLLGRSFDSEETDVLRLTYRRGLNDGKAWWRPQQLQLGMGIWRVPDLEGRTVRYDFSVTPVWRRESGRGYLEGGIGLYLLSATVNNVSNRLPSAFQFGSHV